ncbi:MAG: asparagine--tRNA ligase [bacterium]
MKRDLIAKLLSSPELKRDVTICGWARTRRDSKEGFSFIEVNDGSCLENMQVIADGELLNYESEIKKIMTGTSIMVEGVLIESCGKGQAVEIKARRIVIIGSVADNYPLQKKRHSLEFLRTIAHLRPRTNLFGTITRIRNCLSMSIHNFFQARDFVYLHTPIITCADCEGAGEMFKVTTLDFNNIPHKDGHIDYSADFFGKAAYLTVSGQLEGEIYASALGKVYTFGPTFRADNSNTSRHLAEFWMVEPEMAFCDLEENQALAEEFLKVLFEDVLVKCPHDINLINNFVDKTCVETLKHIIDTKFVILTYTEAIDCLEKSGKNFEFKVHWGVDLQSEHERYLCEEKFKSPVILVDYPKDIKAFYMRLNSDDKTVAAMDVLVPKIGEIIGGSQREERYDMLLHRLEEGNLNKDDYWWYLELRQCGSIPHAGFGLGFDRLVQFVTGMSNIRDVIPFARTPKNAAF